MYLKYICLDL
jgi:hypothetical protein